ncbi:MAG TPA: hypothetical protein DCZ13_11220 [Porticoccaceae bacterium]|nr:hypothetical protein [Porticoccaceae bacterium]
MSLLLDALKEAEQTRNAKAGSNEGGPADNAPRETQPAQQSPEEPLQEAVDLNLDVFPEAQKAGAQAPATSAGAGQATSAHPAPQSSAVTEAPARPQSQSAPESQTAPQQAIMDNQASRRMAADVFKNRRSEGSTWQTYQKPLLAALLLAALLAVIWWLWPKGAAYDPALDIAYDISGRVDSAPSGKSAPATIAAPATATVAPQAIGDADNSPANDNTVSPRADNVSPANTDESRLNPGQTAPFAVEESGVKAMYTGGAAAPATYIPEVQDAQGTTAKYGTGNGIQISKRSVPRNTGAAELGNAKQAMAQGDLTQAASLYRKLLDGQPQHIAAMIGLADTLVLQKNVAAAKPYYRAALEIEPGNVAARAGLLNIEATDPANLAAGSQLKQLITQHPERAHLHASLGDFYARRKQWGKAQASYFEALALAQDNPDYAFNLAVMLDRMGKTSPARDYYQKALVLATEKPARFAQQAAQNRLQQLQRTAP